MANARQARELHATPAMRTLVSMEIQKVLDYVTEVNRRRNLAATVTHYYDSWRQLTEILFCVAPNDLLDVEAKKNLILNILQDLLNKIPPAEVLPQLGNLASGTVLLLLVNLRHCYIMQKRESSLKSTDFESTFFGPSNQIMQTKSLTLKFILQKILSWIIVSSGSTPKMRVNLYGALLNYLNIVNLKTSPAESFDPLDANETYVSRLDNSIGLPTREESTLKSMVIDVMNEFGDNLCSIVCNDCVAGGHDVCRMVALSCLETLAELCPQSECARTLTGQGYLRSLVDSLLQDDAGLQQALEPNPKSLRVLYVYESKMALIIKLAHSGAGAAGALCGGALACLAQLKALDCHPDIHMPSSNTHSFLPSAADRFRQILLPALSLCDALLTSLGTHNHSCVLHVLHVLLSHVECVDMVLRAAHPSSPPGLLIEVKAITSVIARASNRQVLAAAQADTSFQHAAAGIARIQALMLALIPRFANPASEDDHDNIVYHKIVCNLVLYARNILDKDTTHTLFPPSLGGASDGGADCGAVLALTQGAVRRCLAQGKLLATAEHQCDNVHTMTLDGDGGADCGCVLALTQGAAWRCLAQGKLLATAEHQRDNVHTAHHDAGR
ncbi:hypothetical protein JYU34_010718 [Plutella xylostella]|uniref:Uncharacterized protein n=1 Tax=Plutella xylostella TaxID=51655 RepID=A0ABQ7QF33_PLUXY|nr:hypothetical protein JYU34_010718 [Plutella xylostella]